MITTRRVALLGLLVPLLMAPAGGDPVGGPFQFSVERNGESVGFFQTCRGLGSTTEVVEVRDGANPNVVRKIPGPLSVGDVICTRGLTSGNGLHAWRSQVEKGDIGSARSTVKVTVFDAALSPLAQWELLNAWPSELLAVGTSSAAVESVTIVSEQIQRIDP